MCDAPTDSPIMSHTSFATTDGTSLSSSIVRARATNRTASAAGGLLGPVLLGYILDVTGGGQSPESWGIAFAVLGGVILIGGVAVRVLSQPRETKG